MTKISGIFSKILMVSVLLLAGFSAYAQNSFTVTLKLVDEKTDEPVAAATASLTLKGEKTAAKYALTNNDGEATLGKARKGTYIVRAELMGYKA